MKKNTKEIHGSELKEYTQVLFDVKKRIQEAQVKAILSVNKELIKLYWTIGKIISEKQKNSEWGAKVIEKLAQDLQNSFPGVGGFSKINIFRMRALYLTYEIVSQAVTQFEELPIFHIPWGHNVVLITKIKNNEERLWYAQKSTENGWSRSILEMQIKSDLYNRQGKAITNFANRLPSPDSDMAQQSFKDPYIFNFLTFHEEHVEKDLEEGLINNVQKTLLEMGKGFAFIGRQYHLQVSDNDYYIDLLFYHLRLRCYIVVELKTKAFKPTDAGQLNFYLSVVDDQLRHPDDKPTIGLLLCQSKDNVIAEYALRDLNKPIGVAEYELELRKKLPNALKGTLPSIEEIEAEFEKQKELDLLESKAKKKLK